ncbi:arylesterase [Acidipila sp. EB88]|uniref:arylesterase n=1 Tax=Acidipila sp. EB88 TaxID=2305226 RepID=UPI000F5EBED0|nr:arylesterase [Acidipila sp. EB88]RRA47151.1 arylesterase [Acidipila sp. EB88]
MRRHVPAIFIRSKAGILAALLAGCSTLPASAQHKPSAPRTQTVVCFGDSLTAGYGAAPGTSYPDFLRKALEAASYHATILNQGISGNTTKDGVSRVANIIAEHPSLVLLEFGANDGLRGQPVDGIQRNLVTMIEALQHAHIKVLLLGMQLPPNLGPDYVKPFDAMYPALAARYKLRLVPFLLKDVYGHDELMSADSMHPNGAGYAQVARNVLPFVEPLLEK